MLRILWTAHRTNASILRHLTKSTCLQKFLEYLGHNARSDGDNLEKIVVTGKVEGQGHRGCSTMRWLDQIHSAPDSNVHIALHVAKNRVKWRDIVRKIVNGRGHDPQKSET
ncbi:jg8458 [Pararge aegeria aegeria]|uniref:Jg8458 protein n=1 Tax=Pararge aegeria aegeria TaxID=348720 RepID=A0A8S4RVQ5_9NEOP|nr:jg8458 [Pararge aegeria aegeria]